MSRKRNAQIAAQAEAQSASTPAPEAEATQTPEAVEAERDTAAAERKAEREAARAEAKAQRKAEYEAMLAKAKARREAVNPEYAHRVVSVVARGVGGRPCRVVVRCEHEGCEETREIATQDLFQVKYCLKHRTERSRAAQA